MRAKLEAACDQVSGEVACEATRIPTWDAAVLSATRHRGEVLARLRSSAHAVNEDLESLARFLDLLTEASKPEMRPAELTEVWNRANLAKLNSGWVMRRLKGHRMRGELPDGLRPKWSSRHGTP